MNMKIINYGRSSIDKFKIAILNSYNLSVKSIVYQTLRNYLKDYESGGMKSLLSFHYTGRPTILSEFECKELEAHLSDNTYLTSYQIRQYIKAKYKKEYSKKGIISLLHKMGFVYKKAKLVPGNPDEVKQKEFVANYNKLSENLPEDEESKRLPFAQAATGAIGVETLLPLSLEMYHNESLPLNKIIETLTINPAKILKIKKGNLSIGNDADFCIVDLNKPWIVKKENLISKSKNTSIEDKKLQGKVTNTFVKGRELFKI